MRIFRGILASVAVVGVLACGGDKSTGPSDGESFSATYNLSSVDGRAVPATFTPDETGADEDITVKSGKLTFKTDGTYTVSLTIQTESTGSQTIPSSGTYEVSGDTIALTDDTGTSTASYTSSTITYDDPDSGLQFVFKK